MEFMILSVIIVVILLIYGVFQKEIRVRIWRILQEYIGKIAYVLSAPVLVVIQLCYDFMKIFTDFLRKLLHILLLPIQSAGVIMTHVDEHYEVQLHKRLETMDGRKKVQRGIQLYKDALMKDKQSFVNLSIQTVVVLGTLFLQYVSFATTYRGISFYFQELAPGAAGLITLVIQCSLLVLANAIVHRQRFTIGRVIMLFYFMLTSMFFSFTGIVNQEISPEINVRKHYNAFYKSYENLRNDVLSKSNQSSDAFSISTIESNITNLKNRSESLRKSIEQSLETHQSQLDASIRISYDENGYPIYDTTQKDSSLLALIDKETQQIQRLSELNAALSTDTIDISLMEDASFEQKDLEEKMKLLNDTSTHYEEVQQAYENLSQYMISIDEGMKINALPDTLGSYYHSFQLQKQLQNEKCLDYDTLRAQVTDKKTDMTNVADILQLQSLITREINEHFVNTELSDEVIASDSEYYASTMKLKEKALQFDDINLVALSRLHPDHEDFRTALFLLMLAIFVDGTTVLMPFFMNKTRKTILYANRRKDMRFEEEDVLGDLMMQIDDDPYQANEKLQQLFSIFTLTPYLQEKGYAMMCGEEQLHAYLKEEGAELRDCVLFLQHCGYMEYTTKETMNILRKEAGLSENVTQHVYLVKTKLLIWLKQNAAYASHSQGIKRAV